MREFNNRIELQREVIRIVNNGKYEYQITGISKNAIERWIMDNNVQQNSNSIKLLYLISSKLFFLANKSQEQITEKYKQIKSNISEIVNELIIEMNE